MDVGDSGARSLLFVWWTLNRHLSSRCGKNKKSGFALGRSPVLISITTDLVLSPRLISVRRNPEMG